MNDSIFGIEGTEHDLALGTIGGGNHFAELQIFDSICEPDLFEKLKLDKKQMMLLVHSGSRGLGEALLRRHVDQYKDTGLDENSVDAKKYLAQHNHAVQWAKANRALIAHRFFVAIGCHGERVLDVCHNSVFPQTLGGEAGGLHRKGAAPSDEGAIVIPGSRGSFSYLVLPTGKQEESGMSLAHGAGRKWKRGESKSRLKAKHSLESLQQTKLGSKVICENRDLLYEEAPEAYKNIDVVVNDLEEAGLL